MFVTSRFRLAAYVLGVIFCVTAAFPEEALAKKKAKDYAAFAFDADTRKKTRKTLGRRLSYSGSMGLRHLQESGLALDGPDRRSVQTTADVSLAVKLRISEAIVGFAHLELSEQHRTYAGTRHGARRRLKVKEAQLSFALSDHHRLSVGRLRFSEPRRWAMDAAGDGVHIGYKTNTWGWEAAVFQEAFADRGLYGFAHLQRYAKTRVQGIYGLLEKVGDARRFHFAGYAQARLGSQYVNDAYLAGVVGDGAGGLAADVTVTRAFAATKFNPQWTVGFAFGTDGYVEPRLSSHKAKEGGQAQFKRFGTVFQPELTNLAVATAAIGLRPSRKFSIDLRAHAYAQLNASTIAPAARVSGRTTGRSRHVGHEVSLVGAWRPRKKSKVEFGVGVFKPGRAYENRRSAKRVYLRMTQYF